LAQRSGQPRINIATAIVAEPATQIPLPIQVGPPEALPNNSFVRLRGLPPSVSLTEGHAIGPGSWAVPLFGLPTLKANVPTGVSGRSELIISLVAVDGTLLAEARSALVVAPPAALTVPEKRASAPAPAPAPPADKQAAAAPPPAPVPAARPERSVAPRPPDLSAEERTRLGKLLDQGEKYLTYGNIEVARQFFQRAADGGLALAALRLAATYDPSELARLQAQGIVPDPALARKWYERARELGAPEAEERLARLGSR
jgi:hypothetical protein